MDIITRHAGCSKPAVLQSGGRHDISSMYRDGDQALLPGQEPDVRHS
jgi:hypothetical protein